jgi:ribose-phosphate pyrophosphokinase
MIILNLTNPEKSDIKYKINKFPDGQQSIDLVKFIDSYIDNIKIETRLNSFLDLEILICATKALRNMTNKSISLYVPYFLGSRSDRKFATGGVNYLKQVICPIINSLEFDSVEVLDPHSDVLEACLNNFVKYSNFKLVKFALADIDNKDNSQERVCLVSPDAGAYKKIFDVAKAFKIKNITTASKIRDLKTGQILRTEILDLPINLLYGTELKYIIVDDICDGGRTFIELAKEIKRQRPNAKIYLIVTHGIFSAGYAELGQYFEQIYTTNSYKEIGEVEFHGSELLPTKVKQLNIF